MRRQAVSKWLGLAAVALASVNIFGGFARHPAHAAPCTRRRRSDGTTSLTPFGGAVLYLVAGVLFIMALRGLSSPQQPRAGNRYGIIGMTIAMVTTLDHASGLASLPEDARRDRDRWRSRLRHRAADHDDRHAAARCRRSTRWSAWLQCSSALRPTSTPYAFGIAGAGRASSRVQSRIEMGLGIAIGAITFSGSVIAFLKLNGNMSGAPIMLPGRHVINLGTLVAIIGPDRLFHRGPEPLGAR